MFLLVLAALAAPASAANRVMVVQWLGVQTDFRSAKLQNTVKNQLEDDAVVFRPGYELYQRGRALGASSMVSDEALQRVREEVARAANTPTEGLSSEQWLLKAHRLRALADVISFVDRPELRQPLFELYVQIGRAAENSGERFDPFFQKFGGNLANTYWLEASALAEGQPELFDTVDESFTSKLRANAEEIDARAVLSLQFEGIYDGKGFAHDHKLVVNGLLVEPDPAQGLIELPVGRLDVMVVGDDDALTDRIDGRRLHGERYELMERANHRVSIELVDGLFEPGAPLDAGLVRHVQIYAERHAGDELYVAVPVGGSAKKVALWRWDGGSLVPVKGTVAASIASSG